MKVILCVPGRQFSDNWLHGWNDTVAALSKAGHTWGYSMAGSDRSVEILILVRILPFKGRECQLGRQVARRLQQYSKLSTYPSSL